jgi:hypothetical protein
MSDTDNLLPVPLSGQAIDLRDTTDTLAGWIDELKDVRRQISSTIEALGDEITQRLDTENRRSAPVGSWVVETKAPFTTEYDVTQLHDVLYGFADQGILSGDVVARTVIEPDVSDWKVDRREVNKLLKHPDERVRVAVAACGREVQQRRSVTVKRAA